MSRHKPPPHQAKKRGREKRRRPLTLAAHRTFAPQSEVTLPPDQLNPDALGWTALMPRPERSGRYALTNIYEYPADHPQSQVPRTLQGNRGVYEVIYILSLPGKEMFRSNFPFGELKDAGDSLLLMPGNAVRLDMKVISGPPGVPLPVHIIGHANAHGALARLEMRLDAADFRTAQAYAHNWMTSFLSWWSFVEDVEIEVAGVYVLEESTGVSRWIGGILGREKAITPRLVEPFKTDHRALFSSYREALVATNPFYKALCFYRIAEGVKKMRGARAQVAIQTAQQYREPEEQIPLDNSVFDELERESFKPYLGWKFERVRQELRKLIRNALAHIDPTQDVLVADEYDDVERCEDAIPVLRYVARQMLRHEIDADPDYTGITIP